MTMDEYRAKLKACANYIDYAQHHRVSADSTKKDALDCAKIAAQAISEHGLGVKYDRTASGSDPGMGLAFALAACIEWAVDCNNAAKGDPLKLRHCSAKALYYANVVLDKLEGKSC